MKNLLNYQSSEYDCGPTTLVNALRYLFEREEIHQDMLKAISMYTLDAFGSDGEIGKCGTSRMAMMFLSNWFNQFGKTRSFPIHTEMLIGDQVTLGINSAVTQCVEQGGVAIVCIWLGNCKHYVLITGMDLRRNEFYLFDPYDWDGPVNRSTIFKVEGRPKKANRRVSMDYMNQAGCEYYQLGAVDEREAMLLYNENKRMVPDDSIEYFI